MQTNTVAPHSTTVDSYNNNPKLTEHWTISDLETWFMTTCKYFNLQVSKINTDNILQIVNSIDCKLGNFEILNIIKYYSSWIEKFCCIPIDMDINNGSPVNQVIIIYLKRNIEQSGFQNNKLIRIILNNLRKECCVFFYSKGNNLLKLKQIKNDDKLCKIKSKSEKLNEDQEQKTFKIDEFLDWIIQDGLSFNERVFLKIMETNIKRFKPHKLYFAKQDRSLEPAPDSSSINNGDIPSDLLPVSSTYSLKSDEDTTEKYLKSISDFLDSLEDDDSGIFEEYFDNEMYEDSNSTNDTEYEADSETDDEHDYIFEDFDDEIYENVDRTNFMGRGMGFYDSETDDDEDEVEREMNIAILEYFYNEIYKPFGDMNIKVKFHDSETESDDDQFEDRNTIRVFDGFYNEKKIESYNSDTDNEEIIGNEDTEESESEDETKVASVLVITELGCSSNDRRIYLKLRCRQTDIIALVDTGAQVSVIDVNVFNHLNIMKKRSLMTIAGAVGNPIKTLGKANLPLKLTPEHTITVIAYILPLMHAKVQMILGIEALRDYKMEIDLRNNIIKCDLDDDVVIIDHFIRVDKQRYRVLDYANMSDGELEYKAEF